MATAESDYYDVLGVSRTASDADIKKAFRKLARELHPDVSDAPDAGDRFRQAAEAYEVLSDPERRATYDRFGHAGLRNRGFTPGDMDFAHISDIFNSFFGERFFGGGQPRPGSARGADVGIGAEISLADVLHGTTVRAVTRVALTCERCGGDGAEPGTRRVTCPTCAGTGRLQQVSQSVLGQFVRSSTCSRCEGMGEIVQSPCERCDGAGRTIEERSLDVDVPAGIHDGQRIRLRGEGHAGPLGGPPGDLFVQVRIRPEENLERDGDDLRTAVAVTMTEAALGTSVTVRSPEGELDVDLAPGTQPGSILVVKGRGMPSLSTGRRGNLIVQVGVRIPQQLTEEQRTSLERLDKALGRDAYRDQDEGFFDRLKSAFR